MRRMQHGAALQVVLTSLALVLVLAPAASASRVGSQQQHAACGDDAPAQLCRYVAAAGCSWPLGQLCSRACGACSTAQVLIPRPLGDNDLPLSRVLFPAVCQPSSHSARRLAAVTRPASAKKPTKKHAPTKRPTIQTSSTRHAPTKTPAKKPTKKQPAKKPAPTKRSPTKRDSGSKPHAPTKKPASTPHPVAKRAAAKPAPTMKAGTSAPLYGYTAQTHNGYRARHRATPAMVYDAGLESSAQAWANKCIFAHSGTPGVGENLYEMYYYSTGPPPSISQTWGQGVAAWYNEIAQYNYANPGFSEATGHFTQVVWVGSTHVGCGVASCPYSAGINGRIFVCQYSPPGNVDAPSYFKANVMPLKSASG